MIIRDLLISPKRFTDLHRGLPGIPTNVLTVRLKELEQASVLRRRILPRPDGSIVYELTEYGMELEEIVDRLGRWGVKSMHEPREGEIITVDSLLTALRSTFCRDAARRLKASFELRFGEIVIHAVVNEGSLTVGKGNLPSPDLIIETGPALKALMAGEITPGEAVKNGSVRLIGDSKLLTRFVDIFHVDTLTRT
jgi:DNA-binding HxlR family transcriptional regulator